MHNPLTVFGKEYVDVDDFILKSRRSSKNLPPKWKEQVELVRYPWVDLSGLMDKEGEQFWIEEECVYFIRVMLGLYEDWNEHYYNLILPFIKQLQQEGIFKYETVLDGVKPTRFSVVRGRVQETPFNNARKLKSLILESNSVFVYGENEAIKKLVKSKRIAKDSKDADLIIIVDCKEYEYLRTEIKRWDKVIVL